MTFERIKELYVLVINGFVNCIKRTLPTLIMRLYVENDHISTLTIMNDLKIDWKILHDLHCAFERWIIPSLPI
jgi:hypothetical protein